MLLKKTLGKCLLNKLLKLNRGCLGSWSYIFLKLIIFMTKQNLQRQIFEWMIAKNVAEINIPWFPWPGQITKFNPKMKDFKRVLDLTWSKERNLFNWLLKLKNFVLSNGLKTCEMWSKCIKIAIFSKTYKKSPSGWVLCPQTPIASGGWWLCPQATSVTRLSSTNLLTMSPNFD